MLPPTINIGAIVSSRTRQAIGERDKLLYLGLVEMIILKWSKVVLIVCFLLGNTPAPEVYMPTFRNSVCSITQKFICRRFGTLCSITKTFIYRRFRTLSVPLPRSLYANVSEHSVPLPRSLYADVSELCLFHYPDVYMPTFRNTVCSITQTFIYRRFRTLSVPLPRSLYADVSEHSVCSITQKFICRRFGTLSVPLPRSLYTDVSEHCLFHYPEVYVPTFRNTLFNYSEESMEHSGHGESLKSR
jgi:hypothetical protein